jgi:hypothetical protein
MFRFTTFPSCALAALLALAACSPSLNWREVRPDGTRLNLLLPCKPDKAQKMVPLGGRATPLSMLGCDADGATFAVAVADVADVADVGDAAQAALVLAQWQALTLANMKAAPASLKPLALKIPGAAAGLAVSRLQAQGQRADGAAVSTQAAYFAQGSQLFQVVMYAPTIAPEAAETFFSSLKFD